MTPHLPFGLRFGAARVRVLEEHKPVPDNVAVAVIAASPANVGIEGLVLSAELEHSQAALLHGHGVAGVGREPLARRGLVLGDERITVGLSLRIARKITGRLISTSPDTRAGGLTSVAHSRRERWAGL